MIDDDDALGLIDQSLRAALRRRMMIHHDDQVVLLQLRQRRILAQESVAQRKRIPIQPQRILELRVLRAAFRHDECPALTALGDARHAQRRAHAVKIHHLMADDEHLA